MLQHLKKNLTMTFAVRQGEAMMIQYQQGINRHMTLSTAVKQGEAMMV